MKYKARNVYSITNALTIFYGGSRYDHESNFVRADTVSARDGSLSDTGV